jgi:hypothetical protein
MASLVPANPDRLNPLLADELARVRERDLPCYPRFHLLLNRLLLRLQLI